MTLPRQRAVGRAGRPLGALLHQVERVQPGPQLVRQQQVGQGLVLGGEPLVAGGGPGGRDQVERPVRGGRGAVQLAVGEEPGGGDGGVPRGRVGQRGPLDRDRAGAATRAAQRSDSSRKSAGSNIASAMPSEYASAPPIILFWLRGFSMISFSAAAGPMSRGSR